jgi:hypothetical protein
LNVLCRDFQKLCTLQFPKYHTFLRYFTPQPVTDGSKVITQDSTGQYKVATKTYTNGGGQVSGLVSALRPQTPKHIRGGWFHYTNTNEPVDGNGAQKLIWSLSNPGSNQRPFDH